MSIVFLHQVFQLGVIAVFNRIHVLFELLLEYALQLCLVLRAAFINRAVHFEEPLGAFLVVIVDLLNQKWSDLLEQVILLAQDCVEVVLLGFFGQPVKLLLVNKCMRFDPIDDAGSRFHGIGWVVEEGVVLAEARNYGKLFLLL